jgi:hypothetical protein
VDKGSGALSILRAHPRTHRAYVFIIRPTFSPNDYAPLNNLSDAGEPGFIFFFFFLKF